MEISLEELKNKRKIENSFFDTSILAELEYKSISSLEIFYSVRLNEQNDEIILYTKITGKFLAACDRCLEEFCYTINLKNTRKIDLEEFGSKYDIKEEIRQNIVMSFPMKFLCGSSCMGLCQKCGKNLNYEKCNCNDRDVRIQ